MQGDGFVQLNILCKKVYTIFELRSGRKSRKHGAGSVYMPKG